jgi:hypothetical protein
MVVHGSICGIGNLLYVKRNKKKKKNKKRKKKKRNAANKR